MDKYCPQGEIKKLEIKLWNLKVKGNNVLTYTELFQELTLICTKFVANETKKIDKNISGLPDNIFGKLRTYAERQTDNKRKADDPSRNNHVGNVEKKWNASRDSDYNVVTGTFLLNNRYASIIFDTGADRSFISTAFSSLNDIIPTPLGNSYDVELVDGKIVEVETIMRGCTLNFLNHPFNIDLMLVELGSFDVIIGMDWLRSNDGRESRLTIISCPKSQEYMAKGCQIFLAQISKKEEDKLEGKQLKDVSIV
nr:putative reverse transcriptase domain-containing protein [Tanacetum cinerariifolium]